MRLPMMFSFLRTFALLAGGSTLLPVLLHAQQPGPAHLNDILRQMDAASAKFKSAEADFKKDLYQRVVNETTTQSGSIYFLRNGSSTQMGAVILPPDARTVEFKDGRLRLYDPGTDQVTEIDARSNQAQYESFLTLGFGGSGKDLEARWDITDQGTESVSDGSHMIKVEKLNLVAKDPGSRSTFTRVTIWVDPTRAVSLKQETVTPSDDKQTVSYSNIRYNEKVSTERYAIRAGKKKKAK